MNHSKRRNLVRILALVLAAVMALGLVIGVLPLLLG